MTIATKQLNVVKYILNKSILSDNIIELILIEYWNFLPKQLILLNWIDINNLNWSSLCENTNAVNLLLKNIDKIDWNKLSINVIKSKTFSIKNVHLSTIEQNCKIDWKLLSQNPDAIHLIEQNLDKIDWSDLSKNPNAIHLLENNKDKIDWSMLSMNENAIHLLEQNLDKVNWGILCNNYCAIPILEKNQDKIDWSELSKNDNCNAIQLLQNNLDKINWSNLSENIRVIPILKKNQDKIDWNRLSKNPSIFKIEKNPYVI